MTSFKNIQEEVGYLQKEASYLKRVRMILGKKMNQGHDTNEPNKITRLSAIYVPNRIAYHYLKK